MRVCVRACAWRPPSPPPFRLSARQRRRGANAGANAGATAQTAAAGVCAGWRPGGGAARQAVAPTAPLAVSLAQCFALRSRSAYSACAGLARARPLYHATWAPRGCVAKVAEAVLEGEGAPVLRLGGGAAGPGREPAQARVQGHRVRVQRGGPGQVPGGARHGRHVVLEPRRKLGRAQALQRLRACPRVLLHGLVPRAGAEARQAAGKLGVEEVGPDDAHVVGVLVGQLRVRPAP